MWNWIVQNGSGIVAICSAIGLISLFLIFKQIRDSRIWNKLHFTYTFFPDPFEFEQIEVFLDERIEFWKRDDPLTDLEVKALIGRQKLEENEKETLKKKFGPSANKDEIEKELFEAGRKLKLYLNQIESYCAGIESGIVDSETARLVYHYKFKRAYTKALPWIEKIRQIKNEATLYIEMKKVLDRWYPQEGQQKKY